MGAYTVLAYFSLIIYVLLGIYLYKKNREYFPFIFIIYFYQFTAVISSVYLEHGVYITEQFRSSYANGSTFRLVLYNLAFFIPLSFFLRKVKFELRSSIRIGNITGLFRIFAYAITAMFIALLYLNLIVSGIPFFSDTIDRYTFWNNYSHFSWAKSLQNQIPVLAFLLGLFHAYSNSKKINFVSVFLVTLIIVYLVLFGEKFSGIFRVVYMYLLPYLVVKFNLKRIYFDKKSYFVMVLGIILVASLVIYDYSGKDQSVQDLLINRVFGLQGHTWWGADEYLIRATHNYQEHLIKEFDEIIHPTGLNSETGMGYLMTLVSPHLAPLYIKNGSVFAMGYPVILLFTFGYLGAVAFQILMAFIFALNVSMFYYSIRNKQIISVILCLKIFSGAFNFLLQGNFSDFFNKETLVAFYLLLMSLLLGLLAKKLVPIKKSNLVNNTTN